jgi:hypothetical protein
MSVRAFDAMQGAWARMSASDRRAITLGVLVLAPFILYFGIVRPYRASLSELRSRADSERALLAREEGLLAIGPTLPRLADAARERAQRGDMRLVRGANRALEEAELTSYLERTAALSRVLLQESRGIEPPRGTDTTGVVRPIRLAVRGESDLKGVLTYLQRLEASPLLLHIAELSMEPVQPNKTPDAQNGVVKFALVLEAYAPTGAAHRSIDREVAQ